MTNSSYTSFLALLVIGISQAFQTSQMLPMTIESIPKDEIRQRLGLKQDILVDLTSQYTTRESLSIGSGPTMGYALNNEHEVVCPISGAHQGVLCTASLSQGIDDRENAESIANNHDLISQSILSGSLAASIRSRCLGGDSAYYLPFIVTLVESYMADELESLDLDEMVFNSGGLETNEILMEPITIDENEVMLYACNTSVEPNSATSDIYLIPREKKGKVWKVSVEYKLATINLQEIRSFGARDSNTPLRPDVWLYDDSY